MADHDSKYSNADGIPRFRRPSIFVQAIKWAVGLAIIGAIAYWFLYLR